MKGLEDIIGEDGVLLMASTKINEKDRKYAENWLPVRGIQNGEIILDNGSANIEVLVPYNKSFASVEELNTNYTKEGYLFNNWISTTSANKMPAHNVTVTAQWTIQTYTIKLYYNNIFNIFFI